MKTKSKISSDAYLDKKAKNEKKKGFFSNLFGKR